MLDIHKSCLVNIRHNNLRKIWDKYGRGHYSDLDSWAKAAMCLFSTLCMVTIVMETCNLISAF